jgi:uncharacterized protein
VSVFLLLLLLIIVFMAGISLVLFVIGPILLLQPYRRTVEYYRKRTTILHPADLSLPFEDVALKTTEGLTLSAWLISAGTRAKGTIVYLHGVEECKIVGLPFAKELFDEGYNVFLYDSRRHGDSEGKVCTYGFYEKHDARTAIDYLASRHDLHLGPVGLFGASMGAAVALQVAAIDRRVRAVVAESGFATLRSVFDDYQKRMIILPWHYLRNIVIKRSERIAHFKANAVSPLESIGSIHVPVFILHGTADDRIDYRYSEQLFAQAHEPKELWLIPGARHNNMAEIGGEEYVRRIRTFFRRTLLPAQSEST